MKRPGTLTLISVFLLMSCDKDKTATPEPVALSSFSCTVNGEQWTAETPPNSIGPLPITIEYMLPEGSLTITAVRKKKNAAIYDQIVVVAKNVTAAGSYSCYTGSNGYVITGFTDLVHNYPCGEYKYRPFDPGMIEITQLDTGQHILKGHFNMLLSNPSCGPDSLLQVSEGQFDCRY